MDRTFDPRVDSFVFAKHLIIFAIEYHEKNQINAAIKSEVKTLGECRMVKCRGQSKK